MGDTERKHKQRCFDEIKSSVRRIESLFEIIVLAFTYYTVWKTKYNNSSTSLFLGNGKYLLTFVYGFLNFMGMNFKLCKCNNHQKIDHTKNAVKEGNAEERPNADCEIIR